MSILPIAQSWATQGAPLPSQYAPVSLRTDERGVDEVLSEKPRLEFASTDDVGDEEVVGAVITEGGDTGRRIMGVAEDQLVRLEQPGQHRRHLLAAIRGLRYLRELRHVSWVAYRDPTEDLHPLSDFVHQRQLLVGVLVEQLVRILQNRR